MLGMITVRLAKVSDAKSLFDWRNDPNIRAASEQTKPLIWEDHIRWLTHTLQSDTQHVPIGDHERRAQMNANGHMPLQITYTLEKGQV